MVLPLDRLHRNTHCQAVAGILTSDGAVVLAAVLVVDTVAGDAALRVVDGAAAFDFSRARLVVVLPTITVVQAITSNGTNHRAQRRGGIPAMTLANLVADDATGHTTHDGATVAALSVHTLGLGHPVAAALVARHVDVFILGIDAAHAGLIGEALGLGAQQGGGEQAGNDKTFHEALLGVGMEGSVCELA